MLTSSGAASPDATPYGPTLRLLLQLVGRANTVYFLSQCPPHHGDEQSVLLRKAILDWICPKDGVVLGNRDLFQQACLRVDAAYARSIPRLILPVHVFPIHEQGTLDAGFVVPLSATPAPEWEVSDAFGTFGQTSATATPLRCLMDLLRLVESVWKAEYGSSLPARWLRPQTLQLLCPIHMNVLSGSDSAQVPLLVAVLRAVGAAADGGALPFGPVPVFATGTVTAQDGRFGSVLAVSDKLAAFVRELGSGHPALLTSDQQKEILAIKPTLLNEIQPILVESLADLLAVPPIHDGLRGIAPAYHPSMNDRLLMTADSLGRSISFDDAASLDAWVLERVTTGHYHSEYYALQTSLRLALNLFHRGQFVDANRHLEAALACREKQPELFGVDDLGHVLGALVDLAIDARTPDAFSAVADSASLDDVARMTGPLRIKVFGARCQFHRFFGDINRAISSGRKAIALADQVSASESGRSRNYLVHALIVAAKGSSGDTRAEFLAEAQLVLNEAVGAWGPQDSVGARATHREFCLHLQAEIARLTGDPFEPDDQHWASHWTGLWGHPWLFTLLSCARNQKNSPSTQRRCLDALLSESVKWQTGQEHTLFGMFHAVYSLAHAVFLNGDASEAAGNLRKWLADRAAEGFPGWQEYLSPLISDNMARADVDRLCDAIRHH